MRDVLVAYPGAQRALFRQYHIGGCSSCGFSAEETLRALCTRNAEQMGSPEAVIDFLKNSQAEDRKIQLSPKELKQLLTQEPQKVRLLDIRTREEYDAVHIAHSKHFTQELMQEILMQWPRSEEYIVLIDHLGERTLDAAAYFAGHGFTNVKALLGGIDAWSEQVDPNLARYTLES